MCWEAASEIPLNLFRLAVCSCVVPERSVEDKDEGDSAGTWRGRAPVDEEMEVVSVGDPHAEDAKAMAL